MTFFNLTFKLLFLLCRILLLLFNYYFIQNSDQFYLHIKHARVCKSENVIQSRENILEYRMFEKSGCPFYSQITQSPIVTLYMRMYINILLTNSTHPALTLTHTHTHLHTDPLKPSVSVCRRSRRRYVCICVCVPFPLRAHVYRSDFGQFRM